MCGLLAMFGDAYASGFQPALDALRRRGPDEEGIWRDDRRPAQLGHRRLSVIDPACGQQPMALAKAHPLRDRYRIVFNGEIYNFRELRRDLEGRGQRFDTRSDTEVLLAGFAEWGPDVLPRLDGMFAFVVYDRQERRVFAARDRFGIKPLYFASTPGTTPGITPKPTVSDRGSASGGGGFLHLASTLDPFFHLPGFPRRLDHAALREYLACQSIPSPLTILRDVRSLPPASCLSWSFDDDQPPHIERYWDISPPEITHAPRSPHSPNVGSDTPTPAALENFTQATDAALRESVKRQLVADVPLGAFLSGGIDSSLMVHYMSEADASTKVKTFSVRFPFGKGYDESDAATAVARHYGCDHHIFDAGDITAEVFAQSVALLDQPMADPAYLPTLSLAQLTRQHVTVAVSGDGGDEMFGGYDRYQRDEAHYPATPAPGRALLRNLIDAGLLPRSLSRRVFAGRDRLLWDRAKLGPFPGTRKDMARLLHPDAAALAAIPDTLRPWRDLLDHFAENGVVTRDTLMRADVWTYLSENCLIKTDRASMAHGLEVRVPMLGNPVADAALPVHADIKLAQGPKSALLALAKHHLPGEVWDRPKHGFSVPLDHYFRGAWKAKADDWVARCAQIAPFLNADEVQRRWRSGREDTRTMYTLLVLLGWLETHPLEA